jgi:Family of unknown function (DUF5996)
MRREESLLRSPVPDEAWPALPYDAFSPTAHLLHMGLQAIGKRTLERPFEPEWANVALEVTSRGLTTGLIPTATGAYSVDVDLVSHEVRCATTSGRTGRFPLAPMSVAGFAERIDTMLEAVGVEAAVNPMPQEVPDPIPFDRDRTPRPYDRALAHAWWRILVSVQRVLQRYHARFRGKTQPIGFMWGTFDLRDVRYDGRPAPPPPGTDFIRRNAMDAFLIEVGWWSGSVAHPRPAFYGFTYPRPPGIETATIRPPAARWDPAMGEFLLEYDDLRSSRDPDSELLAFFESTYQAGAERGGWDPGLVGAGHPE